MVFLIMTILFLIPNNTNHHSAMQHTTFKQKGNMVNTHFGSHTQSWTLVASSATPSYGQSHHSTTTPNRNRSLNNTSHSTMATLTTNQASHNSRYSLLTAQGPSSQGYQNNSSNVQMQGLENTASANRKIGTSSNNQINNISPIANGSTYDTENTPFSNIPVIMMENGFPGYSADPVPLKDNAALLIFGLSFLLIKIVVKKWL